jgi:enoyl-CoA hydratase/carnithine racemase
MAGAGANWRLAQIVGLGTARHMLYTGAILDGEAALDAGLVQSLHAPDELLDAARALAETIAERSWPALELTKLALRVHRPATTAFDIAGQALLFESEEKRRRMTEFLERRKA